MKKQVRAVLVAFVGLALVAWVAHSITAAPKVAPKKLRVMAYSSFLSSFGPASLLKEEFEKTCQCEVELVDGGDSAMMLQKLRLRQDGFHPDLVIGFDQWTLAEAKQQVKWRRLDLGDVEWHPQVVSSLTETFVPFDWAPMTFIYREGEIQPPSQLNDLLDPRFKNNITLQDPRSSTPGLQFFYWIHALKGGDTFAFLKSLKQSIHSVSPSWSSSYGLFKKRQAQLTFSYVTSVVYHWQEEADESYKAVEFPQGHPIQVEFAGVPQNCGACELAEGFVRFMLTKTSQSTIMNKNYMLPVIQGVVSDTLFEKVPGLKTVDTPKITPEAFNEQRSLLVDQWLEVMRQ